MSGSTRALIAGWIAALLLAGPSARGHAVGLPSVDELREPGSERPATGLVMAGEALPGNVDPAQYRLGPGDQLELVFSGPVTRAVRAQVDPEGRVFLPGIAPQLVRGLTLSAAREALLGELRTEYPRVTLYLRLVQVRRLRIRLSGAVAHPGAIEVAATSRTSDVLPDSALLGNASRRNIELRREGSTLLTCDLARLRWAGDDSFDPYLADGDIVHVPVRLQSVTLEGAVARPGVYELRSADRVIDVLLLAGGLLESARPRALLVRFASATASDSATIDLAADGAHVALQNGDRLFVYFEPRFHELPRAFVLGEVTRPGAFPLESGRTRLSEVLQAAGGFLPNANLSAIRVFRELAQDPRSVEDPELDRLSRLSRNEMTSSEYEVLRARLSMRREDFRVDWSRVQPGGPLDPILRDGDVVRVDPVFAQVSVDGEVRRPGLVLHRPGLGVNDYITLAGGFSRRANRSQIRVTRAITGQTIQAQDLDAVSPGDLIWVPDKPEQSIWRHLQTLIAVSAQVATLVIAVRR